MQHNTEIFWNWFEQRQLSYFELNENEQEQLFDDLSDKLRSFDDNLTFEFSGVKENGKREFILSANGMRKSFPLVFQLHETAPNFPNWEIIALKPRFESPKDMRLGINGKDFGVEDIFLDWKKIGNALSVQVHLRADVPNDMLLQIGFIFLDLVLGEYDVATKLGNIDFKILEESELASLINILELPAIVDRECIE